MQELLVCKKMIRKKSRISQKHGTPIWRDLTLLWSSWRRQLAVGESVTGKLKLGKEEEGDYTKKEKLKKWQSYECGMEKCRLDKEEKENFKSDYAKKEKLEKLESRWKSNVKINKEKKSVMSL